MRNLITLLVFCVLPWVRVTAETNLLTNPGAEEGATEGWVILEGEDDWQRTGPPVEGSYCFGTARTWCRRYQIVDLVEKGYSPLYLDAAPEISVDESFIGVFNPGQVYLRVILMGEDDTELVDWQAGSTYSPIVVQNSATGMVWSSTNHVFRDYPAGVRKIYWEDGGRAYPGGVVGPFLDAAHLTVKDRQIPTVSNLDGATNVAFYSADLCGALISTGTAETTVSVYWGLLDGGTNPLSWDRAAHFPAHTGAGFPALYSTNVASLEPSRLYFYRYAASNSYGISWTREASTLATGPLYIETLRDPLVEGGREGLILIGRPGTTVNGPLTVSYTVGGTAEQGTDIQPLTGTLTIPITHSCATVVVEVIDDFLIGEPTETVDISLAPGPYFVGTNDSVTTRILENDLDYLPRWQRRCKITFPGYQNNTPLTNFPALVVLNPGISNFNYDSFASPDGADLRFADYTESYLLPYDIEAWNDEESNAYVWVRVPLLNSPTNIIWAYWDNSSAPTERPAYATNGQTWAQGYHGVWHFRPTETDVFYDATRHRRDGHNYHTQPSEGMVSAGRDFRGIVYRDFIQLNGTPSSEFMPRSNNPINISCWVKPDIISPYGYENFLVSLSLSTGWPNFGLAIGATNQVYLLAARSGGWEAISSTNVLVNSGNWSYLTAEYSGMRYYLSVDGTPIWTTPDLAQDPAGDTFWPTFGSLVGHQWFYDGCLDEVRISDFRPRTEWSWAEMMTMASNSVFTTYGPIETRIWGTVLIVR